MGQSFGRRAPQVAQWRPAPAAADAYDAYDGDELHTYIEDECGKVDEKQGINTDKRWEIVQFCLTIGSKIVGKALRTTTVEEMEKKGGKHFKKTWDESLKAKTNEKK